MRDRQGINHIVQVIEVDSIADEPMPKEYEQLVKLFNLPAGSLRRPYGPVDMLIGMDYQEIHPTRIDMRDKLGLYASQFGT